MSTSRLQRFVSEWIFTNLDAYNPRENARPDWLITQDGERLELDFLVSSLRIAIEVQGGQHYSYVPFYHGNADGFATELRRDRFKKDACIKEGINLYEIASCDDAEICFSAIRSLIAANGQVKRYVIGNDLGVSRASLVDKKTYRGICKLDIEQLRIRQKIWLKHIRALIASRQEAIDWCDEARTMREKQINDLENKRRKVSSFKKREPLKNGINKLTRKIEILNDPKLRSLKISELDYQQAVCMMFLSLSEDRIRELEQKTVA